MFKTVMKWCLTKLFLAGDWLGIHVLPAHYYSSVPRRKWLRSNERLWRRRVSLTGVDWDLDQQVEWLSQTVGLYPLEVSLDELIVASTAVGGFRYGEIEALTLYAVIRTLKPRSIVEIGSGSSTLVGSRAIAANVNEGNEPTEILAVDRFMHPGVDKLDYVTARKIDALELDDLQLHSGDLLFIDSTHTVKTGSEVPHIYLDLVPSLPPGVVIHIHDIYLPYLYAHDIYTSMFDWQETTLVTALLQNNPRLSVLACLSALHHERRQVLASLFPTYRPQPMEEGLSMGKGHFPASLWLKTV